MLTKKLRIALLLSLLVLGFSCSEDDPDPQPTVTVSISEFTGSIDENPENGASIGTISASTSSGSVTFEIVSQTPAGAVAINATSGSLTVADASVFVAANNPTISGTVRATNGEVSADANFSITVNAVNNGGINDGFTVYSGEMITFTKADGADPTEEANQDRITDNVWITRGNTGGQIYNAVTESMFDKDNSPVDTEWALGTTEQGIANLSFDKFRATIQPKNVVDENMVLHLITDDVYIDIKFTSWSQGNSGSGGGFSYERRSAE